MEFKGTQGKWKLHRFPEGQMSVRNEENTRKICVPRVQNSYESEANLLLISKAPEMFEMLNKCLSMAKSLNAHIVANQIEQLIKEATEI